VTETYEIQTAKDGGEYRTHWSFTSQDEAYFYYNAIKVVPPYSYFYYEPALEIGKPKAKRLLLNAAIVHEVIGNIGEQQ
jgi:hypothetical protein